MNRYPSTLTANLLPSTPLAATPPPGPPPAGWRRVRRACRARYFPAGSCPSQAFSPGLRRRGLSPGSSLGGWGACPLPPPRPPALWPAVLWRGRGLRRPAPPTDCVLFVSLCWVPIERAQEETVAVAEGGVWWPLPFDPGGSCGPLPRWPVGVQVWAQTSEQLTDAGWRRVGGGRASAPQETFRGVLQDAVAAGVVEPDRKSFVFDL